MHAELSNKIDLGHSVIDINDEGFVVVKGSDHLYSLADIKAIHEAVRRITNNEKCLLLLRASRYTLIDAEARDFLSTPAAASNFIANAYVIESLAHRMILNFVIRVKGTPIPSKFFTELAAAEEWLRTFRSRD